MSKSHANVNYVDSAKKSEQLKEVEIENVKIPALVDTGSPVSLMREDMLYNLQNVELRPVHRELAGFGKG